MIRAGQQHGVQLTHSHFCAVNRKKIMRIAMNKTCLIPDVQQFVKVAILFTFLVLVVGCYNTRHDTTKKRYTLVSSDGVTSRHVANSPAGTRVYRIGMDDGVTAHYNLWEGKYAEPTPPTRTVSSAQPADIPVATPEMAGQGPIIIEASDVLFDFDKSVIKEAYYGELDRWVAFFMDNPEITAEIYGHADSTGPTVYNQKLSERRAKAVVDYLVAKGVDASRLSPKGFGETVPIAPNTTPEGRQKNRRVEVNF